MLKVEILQYEDLSEEEKYNQPNNGNGKEDANYVVMSHNGEIVDIISDAVESEDATFSRDFHKVIGAIEMAYKLGKEDGGAE